MRSIRLALTFAVTVIVVVASEAQPQPPTAVTTTPLAVVMLNSIDDPVVIADLKLSDEQVKTLVTRRKELWDEAYITSPNKYAEKTVARTEATDLLLKKVLTESQYKRVVQLGAQSVLRTPIFGMPEPDAARTFRLTSVQAATLNRYPELVTAFKLTDDQKKQLTAPNPKGGKGTGSPFLTIAMTKEQADSAKEFLGTVAKTWSARSDPRTANRPVPPPGFVLLEAKDVRTELILAEGDVKALAALAEKWQKLGADRRTDLSPKEADSQAAELNSESEKALSALKPEQTRRLKEIAFQVEISGQPGPAAEMHIAGIYSAPTVAKEIAMTEQQVKEFQALRESFEKDAAAVLGSAVSFDPAEKKLNELVAAHRTKAEGVLTADQTAKLKSLIGKPFLGRTRPDRLGGGGPPPQLLESLRAAIFGKYSTELVLLAQNKSIQEELKLDEKQIKQAAAAQMEITNKFLVPPLNDTEAREKALVERSKAIEEAVGKLLSEDQAKRFRQLMLQSREQRPNIPAGAFTTGIMSAVSYPGVAEEVKLTDDQKKKLIAGTAPADVLTAEQKTAIQKMLGDPFKGNFAIGPPFPALPRATAITRLFTMNEKNAEDTLKLTDDQSKALAAARDAYQKALAEFRPGGPGGTAAARRAAIEAFDKAVTDLLNADQKKRLAQLVVQAEAAVSLVATLTEADMAKRLELMAEQTAKITALGDEATKLQRLRTLHIRSNPDRKLGLQMRDAADERMLAVLTDTQKRRWNELIGDPLPGLEKTVPGPFGGPGGGFSGAGGFGPFGP